MKKRHIGQEILEGIRAITQGERKQYRVDLSYDPKAIRQQMNLGTSVFASLLGGSLRTVQYWEKGK